MSSRISKNWKMQTKAHLHYDCCSPHNENHFRSWFLKIATEGQDFARSLAWTSRWMDFVSTRLLIIGSVSVHADGDSSLTMSQWLWLLWLSAETILTCPGGVTICEIQEMRISEEIVAKMKKGENMKMWVDNDRLFSIPLSFLFLLTLSLMQSQAVKHSPIPAGENGEECSFKWFMGSLIEFSDTNFCGRMRDYSLNPLTFTHYVLLYTSKAAQLSSCSIEQKIATVLIFIGLMSSSCFLNGPALEWLTCGTLTYAWEASWLHAEVKWYQPCRVRPRTLAHITKGKCIKSEF